MVLWIPRFFDIVKSKICEYEFGVGILHSDNLEYPKERTNLMNNQNNIKINKSI